MYRRSKGHIGLTLVAAAALVLSACSATPTDTGPEASVGFAQCLDKPNDCNNGAAKTGGTITYALGKDIKAWNTLSSAGNTLEYSHALFGVIPRVHVYHPDLSVQLNKDMMESATITNKSPMTVVYKIRKEASWNDGTPISADDFIYNYKVQNGKDCPKCTPASTSGFDQVTSVTGSDGGKTVTVEFKAPFPDWQAMFSPLYPAHVAPSKDLETSFKWLETNIPTYSGGPYKIEKFEANFALTLVPNDKYYGTKPTLDKVIYRIITKDSELVPALRNVEINSMAPIPTADLITQTKQLESQVHWYLGKALTWEHIDLNLKNPALAEKPLREAIFTAINRQEIIDKTVGQYAPGTKPIGNHNFVPGHPAYKDHVSASGQGNGNIEAAKKVLTDAGYKIEGGKLIDKAGKAVPPLRMRHTTGNTLRANSCELVQAALKNLGIEVQIVPTDNLGGTLTSGDFDLIIFAWVNSPLRIGGAKQLWFSTSSSNYGKWVNAESDKLLDESNKLVGEDAKAFDLINQANALMVKDSYVLPLFQRETFLAVDKKYTNLRPNPTNHGSLYNVGTWGLLNQAN